MPRLRTLAIGLLLLVAGILLATRPCASTVIPPEQVFRLEVACSDLVVSGRVVATEESTERIRYSQLEVERCLVGSAEAGDTLRVSWRAASWTDGPTGHVGVTSDYGPQLSRLTGHRALYFLREDGGLRLSGIGPIVFSRECKRTIRAMLSWIREPSSSDMLAVHLHTTSPRRASRWPCGTTDADLMDERLEIVARFLEEHLERLEQESQLETGRSN